MLYVVGTPIGNLGDFSPRAVEALESCDFIAAEDTRVTAKLLSRFEIKKPMLSYHEHNRRACGEKIVARLLAGESCCLVTDAGMPAISDPGEDLVRECRKRGIAVVAVPGPTAFASALAISGMPSGRFTFEGFLSMNKLSRRAHLDSLRTEHRTMIFYEAPHKLPATLTDLAGTLGDREVAIVRELTKVHEQVIRTTLSAAARDYADGSLKGEMVLIVAGAPEWEDAEMSLEQAVEFAREMIDCGTGASEAAKRAAEISGFKKGDIYKKLITGEAER